MNTYKFSKSVSDALNLPFDESVELSDQLLIDLDKTCELPTGWNNCKTWKIAIRESMNNFYSSPEAVNVAMLKRESMKRCGKIKNSGFTNHSHSSETKKKCSQAARKYMTQQEIELMFSLYDEGFGHKSIAKKIGYSASSIRKRINRFRQLG
jgi:hypothetical protein